MSSTESQREPQHFLSALEALPWLRHVRPPLLRNMLITLAGAVLTALLFSLITKLNVPQESVPALLKTNLVFAAGIGYSIHLFTVLTRLITRRWLGERDGARLLRVDIFAWLAGGVFGYVVAANVLGLNVRFWSGVVIILFWLCWMVAGVLVAQRRRAMKDLELARERSARSDTERLLTLSHLKLLQAQIEPHFLFNTLANVSTLIDADPKRARAMLDQFTLLLRGLLDQTRQSTTTLRNELQVAEAYLSVLKIRMGERLTYQIDAPKPLADVVMPAMLLQPIVENAVRHGIEPVVNGGIVRVEARQEGSQLMLTVWDNGVGFAATTKESIGMGAIRERLRVQFGAAASLEHSRTADHWTAVTIRIPMPAPLP